MTAPRAQIRALAADFACVLKAPVDLDAFVDAVVKVTVGAAYDAAHTVERRYRPGLEHLDPATALNIAKQVNGDAL